MTRNSARRLSHLFAALAVLFGGLTWVAYAQDEDPAPTEEATAETMSESAERVDLNVYPTGDIEIAIEPTGQNGYCTVCHNVPGKTMRLADGSLLNLYVAPEMLASSVHGPSADGPGLGCLDCHGEDSFPHDGLPPADGRIYTIDANAMCTSCHDGYADELHLGAHAQAIANGNTEAAVCTDCHGAHHVQTADFRPEIMSGVCADCHETTHEQWLVSDHADIGPLGCATCHDYHSQDLRIGETTTDLCLNCHEDNLPETFVHVTHVTEVQGSDYPVECSDCHMVEGGNTDSALLVSTEEGIANHSMLLDATPCNTCHGDLIESGQWDEILSTRIGMELPVVGEDQEAAELMVEAAEHEAAATMSDGNTRFALQGLMLGLGLGITFTIVFVTRNNRREADTPVDEHDGNED
jgi:predicted CXXCH cytochrome family protein